MFTNEQVRTAMTGLVEQKGEGHTSYGKYMDPLTGKGACFLGALCEFMGFAVPAEGTRARDVLGRDAVTREMGDAFGVAQCLNDAHFEWKYVLLGVDLAMKISGRYPPCPCGCGVPQDFTPILDEVKRQRALDKTKAPLYPSVASYATGGIVSGGIMPTFSSTGIEKITVSLDSMITTFSGLSASLSVFTEAYAQASTKVELTKKDHALIA